MSEAEFIFRSMNTHQVLIILVVDTRVLGCVADSFQERRFTRISPTDYKDTKASIFRSEVIGIAVAHGRCGKMYLEGVGMPQWNHPYPSNPTKVPSHAEFSRLAFLSINLHPPQKKHGNSGYVLNAIL